MRYNNKQLLASLALGIILLFGIFSTAITSSSSSYVYAQQQQQQQLQNGVTTSSSTSVGVKITSPTKGQQVSVGSLKISGTSTDNTNSNDCTVYALWDHLKPYQKVKPTGPSGTNDYSNWTFTYTSAYHLITNGTNQLTAKISCLASSPSTTVGSSSTNLTKWYSINVTGMPINQTSNTAPTAASNNITNTTVGPLSPLSPSLLIPLPVPSTTVDRDSSSGDDGSTNDNNNKKLSVSIDIAKDPIVRGNDQTVTVTVSDAETDEKIDGAFVKGSVRYVTGFTKDLSSGSTNNDGQYTDTFLIGPNSKPGTFTVEVHVSAEGYKSGSETADFKVIEASSPIKPPRKNIVPTNTTQDKHSDKDKNDNDNPGNNNDTTTTTTPDGVDNNIGTNLNPPVTDENNDKKVDNGKTDVNTVDQDDNKGNIVDNDKKDKDKDNDGSKPDNSPTTHPTDDKNNNLTHDKNKKDADKKDKDKSKSTLHDTDNKKKEKTKIKMKIKHPKSKTKA